MWRRSVRKTLLWSNLISNPQSGNHHFECRDLWRYSPLLLFYCLETTHPLHLCTPNLKFSSLTLFTLNWNLLYSSLSSNPLSGNHHFDLWRYSPLLHFIALRPPTHTNCVRQTLNLVTLHFLPVYKLYFIVTLHQIHDQAIITLNAGICDATPRCYFFILFALETARQPTLCSPTSAHWRSQCTPKSSVLARLTQYWRNKGMTWNARCLCCLVVSAHWTKTRLI